MAEASDAQAGSGRLPDAESAPPRPANAGELKDVLETQRRGVPFLLYRDDSGSQRLFALDGDRAVTIGRGSDVDVCLEWDPSVSSVHAEAVRLGAHWVVSDEGISRNGTFVNDGRISGRRRLRDGDVIRVGRTMLAFNESSSAGRGTTTVIEATSTTGLATLLFTDLVGSTELLDRLGDDAGDQFVREHFSILREAVSEEGGHEVKSLGDGLMVAFPSALSAVACAQNMQRRVAAHTAGAHGGALGLRIGVNAGEVVSADGDYFGMPVVVAKRLCDRAQAAQTLVSDVVRVLVGSRRDHRFVAIGAMQLKGLTGELEVYELDWREGAGG
ncbi:MAG TPA: adenylate/guanylate cyclase domain-containing protein [Solirubrobacteraceae bacterium]|jgi:class 3 adenylate cyclase|nr:adenylate/guanylate cyclase domain-containing protein [Solirubrobacteraceae bacterium]